MTPLRGAVLTARGSSDNAPVDGRSRLETATRRAVGIAAPSLHTRSVIRGQRLARTVALHDGIDPDQPLDRTTITPTT